MLFFLIDFLHDVLGWKIPSAFTYTSSRIILACITALLFSIICGPSFIRFLRRLNIGQPIRIEECPKLGELHKNKKNTPTMGGLLLITSLLLSMVLWMDLTHIFTLILFLTTLFLALLGGIDDYLKLKYKDARGLRPRYKLYMQFLFSLAIALYFLVPGIQEAVQWGNWYHPPLIKDHQTGHAFLSLQEYAGRIYLPFFKDPIIVLTGVGTFAAGLFMAFVITGCSNAVNLTDGLDGLASGCVVMVACCLAVIAFLSNNGDFARYLNILYIEGSGEIAVYLSAFVGACLGFLWYNGHPAEVFMGDTGSLTLGALLGVSSVLLKRELLLGLVGGIFVVEALSVIIQVISYRYRNKKRVFLCTPLHHHFEYMGWPETKIVIRFWIVGLLLAFIGIISIKFQ